MNKNWKYLTVFVTGAILCLSLVWVANILAGALVNVKHKGVVEVKGFATKQISSNLGIFEVRILSSNADLKLAYEKLAADKKALTDFLKRNGAKENVLQWSPVCVNEKNLISDSGHTLNQVYEYEVSLGVKFQSENVGLIQSLSSTVGELLNEGVRLTIYNPSFLYTDLEELKIEMIGLATENAKKRAHTISKKGNFKLGSISQVRVGVFQITPLNSTDVSDYGVNDTTTIQKEIKCVVDIDYFVR
ncbi:MAG TPA: hypothetical protein DIS66_03690 [Candidatus Omnitrophica bacterium]|nr:hypothetical protein [Candidatus Omnitrophota bacterium]